VFTCPRCGMEDLKRSHARGLERLFRSLSSYRVYRCADCKWRGWLATAESPWRGFLRKCARAAFLLAIVLLTAATAWLITKAFS
jgi:predicted RNA-binding Zn-ribbon protein involved in translation (DUF1610 family)